MPCFSNFLSIKLLFADTCSNVEDHHEDDDYCEGRDGVDGDVEEDSLPAPVVLLLLPEDGGAGPGTGTPV